MAYKMNEVNFNFDNMSLNNFHIGQTIDKYDPDEVVTDKTAGYSIKLKNKMVVHISIYLANFSYGFSKYQGSFNKGSDFIKFSETSSFEEIKNVFGQPYEEWDDGVERNMQFIVDKYLIEFSWNIEESQPKLMYFSVELN